MNDLKPNQQRANTAIILIKVVLAMEMVSLISDFFQYILLQSAANGGEISNEDATANDSRQQLIGVAYMIVYILSAITFIQWFRRAYFNLHTKVTSLSHTEGWAAGSWFVPIVSLFRPYRIMQELYRETESLLSKSIDNSQQIKPVSLSLWWTLWIISNFIGQFVFRYSAKATTVDQLMISTMASMIGSVIGIPLALVTIKVIKNYSEVEPLLHELKDDRANVITATGAVDL